jgi:glycosyltransferase involved in cell wall biosynthesis
LSGKPIRVLHCPKNVGGNPQRLARLERELGLDSIAVALRPSCLQHATEEFLFRPGDPWFYGEFRRWRLLWRAIRYFDIVHFNFGQTIMPAYYPNLNQSMISPELGYPWFFYRVYNVYARWLHMDDLSFLKRAGKGLVVTYQGDDARQGDFCRANFQITHANEVEPHYYSAESDAYKRRNIVRFARYADRIYATGPDLLRVLPEGAEFLPVSRNPREWMPVTAKKEPPERLTVLHAPSHRKVKGTRYVLEAVRRLQEQDRLDFEFILVEETPYEEAKRIYARADLLVDQLLVGWYGGLAVEFMAMAKPVICYLREDDLAFIPKQMRLGLPVINATPNTIYAVLKEWLTTRRNELPELGQRSRIYMERWHDHIKIAARLKSAYESIMASKQRGHTA